MSNLDSSEYVATKIREINGEKYLIDNENNVYLHDIENPTKIGIYVNNSIEYFKKIEYIFCNKKMLKLCLSRYL